MPWVRIDEKAMEHPKVAGLLDGAFRLWVQGLAHCQKFLTDGQIDAVSLKALRSYSPKRAAELIAARLWLTAADGAVMVHDYLQWNESREDVEKSREQARERIRRYRGKGNGVTQENVTRVDTRSFSGDVVCSSPRGVAEGSGERKPVPRARGLMAGSRPLDHGECLAHGPVCFRPFLAKKYLSRFGGDHGRMVAWAERVCRREAERVEQGGVVAEGDDFAYWAARYDEDHKPSHNPKTAGNIAAAQRFAARGGHQ